MRHGRDQVEEQVEATRRRLEDARPQSSVIDTLFRAFERDLAAGGGVLSAAVAFRVFLVVVPFVFFVAVTFGFISELTHGNPTGLTHAAGIGGLVASAIEGLAKLSVGSRVTTLIVSGVALFLGSRSAVKVLRITHGLIWRVPIPKPRRITRAAGAFVGMMSVLTLTVAATGWLRSQSLALGIVGLLLSAAVPFGLWLVVSLWLPRADCPWWALIPGAAWCAVGALVLHVATLSWFTYEMQSKSDTYGAIGVSLVLLLWAYMLGRIITASAAVNAAFWYRNEERRGHAVPAPIDLEARLSGTSPSTSEAAS